MIFFFEEVCYNKVYGGVQYVLLPILKFERKAAFTMNQAFEPFLQPFEKEHTEVLRGSVCISDADLRHFTTKQCIDFANAYRSAMESNDPELMNLAETAGSSAYHYLCYGGIQIGDSQRIKSTCLIGTQPEPLPYEKYSTEQKNRLFYEPSKGVRIKEQLAMLKQASTIMKSAAAMEQVPETGGKWNTLCEALRIDEALYDPNHFLFWTLHFERPGGLERTMEDRHEKLEAFLTANGLPTTYSDLKTYVETDLGYRVEKRLLLEPETQFDLPFDRLYEQAHKDGMLVEPFDAIRSASREAWLIDRMEPSPEKDALVTSYFDRLYDTLHNNPYIQIKPDQELQFAGGILDEIQTGRSYSNMRVMGTTPAAMFLSEYPAYAEARSFAESLASLENQNEVEL